MKRAQYITEIISFHKRNNTPYDINKLTDLSLTDLRKYIPNITNPEPQKEVEQKVEQKMEQKMEQKEEQKMEQKMEQKEEQKVEQKVEQESESESESESEEEVVDRREEVVVQPKKVKKIENTKKTLVEPISYYNTDEEDDFDHIMYIIESYENDIKHLLSLYDLKHLRQEDKDVIYDTYTTYRDELDEDIAPYTLDKKLKIVLRSVINRNRNIIQRYI